MRLGALHGRMIKWGVFMNWFESQMFASAFAKGHGGMSLGQQWGLAAMLRDEKSSQNGASACEVTPKS